jgi:hypothetical protein
MRTYTHGVIGYLLHTVTVSMHSFAVVGPFLALSYMLYKSALPFFIGMLAHGIIDLLTHRQWAYNHLFPFPFAPIRSILYRTLLPSHFGISSEEVAPSSLLFGKRDQSRRSRRGVTTAASIVPYERPSDKRLQARPKAGARGT